MPLNKSKGNMYPWVDYTLTIYRRCDHNCIYCYRKAIQGYEKWSEVAEQDFKLNLSNKGTIFVANTGDLFGAWVDPDIIRRVLQLCRKYPGNTYLFQSKNPIRFLEFLNEFPCHTIFGTTIESNYWDRFTISQALSTLDRMKAMCELGIQYDKMISIEPIMDFDVDVMIDWIHAIKPKFVSIGADSKGHHLPEPSAEKVQRLIAGLGDIEAKLKSNLRRLLD